MENLELSYKEKCRGRGKPVQVRRLPLPQISACEISRNIKAWLLILPSLVFLSLFTLYPILSTFYNSLFRINLSAREPEFIAFENFTGAFGDAVFLKALGNNILIALITIPISIAIAISMAVYANSALRGRWLIKAGYFYPTLLPMIAVANIWLFIYTPGYGLLSYAEGLAGKTGTNWLGDPSTVLPALIVMLIWKEAGYFMVFFLSGLQSISKDMYDASYIDGANKWQAFRHITWPMLMPTTLFVMVIAVTNAFKVVDHLYIMTKGGPDNSSNMVLYYIYQTGFEFWDTGMASAITAILVVMLLAVTCIQFFTIDRKVHYS